jgi:hypothetical protein
MSRRRIVCGSALLLGLLIASGCRKSEPDVKTAPEKTPPAVVKAKPEPAPEKEKKPVVEPPKALQVTVDRLMDDFKDRPKAERKYKGKLLEVEGKVASSKTGSVTLIGKKPADLLPPEVRCKMSPAFAGKAGLVAKGQTIFVKGRFADFSAGNVTLDDCEYAEPVASPPRVTAEALTKAFADDMQAAEKKYLDKDVIVSGTVIDLEEKDGFAVKLAGFDKSRVRCMLDSPDDFKLLKKGDKVTIKGEVTLLVREVVLTTAFLVQKN